MLFLDDMDVFTIVSNLRKRSALVEQNIVMSQKVVDNRITLRKLKKTYFLEQYARSQKFFKQEEEEIFVIIPKGNPQP